MHLPKGSIMLWGNAGATSLARVTEHNRSAVGVTYEKIETANRMIDGTMRKWLVAEKRSWSVSWEMVPHLSLKTVDGGMGGEAMEEFYRSHPHEFTMEIRLPDGKTERVLVFFNSFDKSIEKRGAYEFWNISAVIEEV